MLMCEVINDWVGVVINSGYYVFFLGWRGISKVSYIEKVIYCL